MKRALLIVGGTVGGLGAVLSVTPPQLGVAHGGVSSLAAGSTSPVGSDVATQTSPSSSADPQTSTPTQAPASSTPTTAESTPAPAATSPAASASSPSSPSSPTSPVATKPTPKAKPSATKSSAAASPTATKSSSPTPSQSQSQTPTPTPTPTPSPTKTTSTPTPTPTKTTATPTPVASGISGTFTGATFDALEGNRNLWGRMTVTVTLNDGVISNISASQNPSSRSYNAISYLTSAVLSQKLSVKTVMAITPNSLLSQVRGYTGASYSAYAYWESLQSALSKAGL